MKRHLLNSLLQKCIGPVIGHMTHLANRRWHDYPYGREPHAPRDIYLLRAKEIQNQSYPEIEAFEAESGYSAPLEWIHELALHTQIVIKKSPLCYAHGRVLYSALSRYLADHRDENSIKIWETDYDL